MKAYLMATKDNLKEVQQKTSVAEQKEKMIQSRPGGSNAGDYPHVSDDNFAGNACGLPGAYPIDSMERAKSALRLAHNAKDPECIKRQVYRKWPSLNPDKK